MNQDYNTGLVNSNRFIFSDNFYDDLDHSFDGGENEKKETSFLPQSDALPQEQDVDFSSHHFLSTPVENSSEDISPESKPFSFLPDSHSSEKEENLEEHSNHSTDSLIVDSGVNTSLEQELFQKQEPTVSFNPPSFSLGVASPPKKTVYRATRNTNPVPPSWLEQETPTFSLPPEKETISTFPEVEDPLPTIVNIDEEIQKDLLVQMDSLPSSENLVVDSQVMNNNLLERLREKEKETGKISILARYGEDFCSKDYITNPAIGREKEIKELNLILLTPEKSAVLVGKPGIGKTSIVEGLAYQIQRNHVPDLLKGYRIISMKTTSLLGNLPNGETRLQTLIDELKELDHIILFMDEIHMLIHATNEYGLDFANMFKESLGRGSIKMIGATTNDEYERYILSDKAFVRRFQRVDVLEPNREQTIQILMGSLPKIEKNTSARLKYSHYIQSEIMAFIVDITTEYKRVYGIGSRYPDICLTLLAQAFSQAIFHNRKEVTIFDVRNAIENSKNIYPDVIQKELIRFDEQFKQIIAEEKESSSDFH